MLMTWIRSDAGRTVGPSLDLASSKVIHNRMVVLGTLPGKGYIEQISLVEGDLPKLLEGFSGLDFIVRVSRIGQDYHELFSRNVLSKKENKILTTTK